MKLSFLEIETSVRSKLNQVFSALNQRRCGKEPVLEFEDQCIEEEEQDVSTHLSPAQKNQPIDLPDQLDRYCNVLPVFGFNSAKYDINLMKSCLLPLLVNERGIEPIAIKKASQFGSFKFGNVQLLDKLNFLGGATSLDSFLKAYRLQTRKMVFHMNGSMIQKSSTILNFILTKLSVANCATTILSKKTIQTSKI